MPLRLTTVRGILFFSVLFFYIMAMETFYFQQTIILSKVRYGLNLFSPIAIFFIFRKRAMRLPPLGKIIAALFFILTVYSFFLAFTLGITEDVIQLTLFTLYHFIFLLTLLSIINPKTL